MPSVKYADLNAHRLRGSIALLREAFYNDGAEGESVHLVCAALENYLDLRDNVRVEVIGGDDPLATAKLFIGDVGVACWRAHDRVDTVGFNGASTLPRSLAASAKHWERHPKETADA